MNKPGVIRYDESAAFNGTIGATAVVDGQVLKIDTALWVDAGAATSSEGLVVALHDAAAGESCLLAPIAQTCFAVSSAPTVGVLYDLTNGLTVNLSSGSGTGSPMRCISYDSVSSTAVFDFNR